MTIAIDLDTHLASNLTALAQQGVANTNNFAHYANLAFTKDRIWIAGYDDWQPTDWHDVPPRAIALEPAEAVRAVGRSSPVVSRRFQSPNARTSRNVTATDRQWRCNGEAIVGRGRAGGCAL